MADLWREERQMEGDAMDIGQLRSNEFVRIPASQPVEQGQVIHRSED